MDVGTGKGFLEICLIPSQEGSGQAHVANVHDETRNPKATHEIYQMRHKGNRESHF